MTDSTGRRGWRRRWGTGTALIAAVCGIGVFAAVPARAAVPASSAVPARAGILTGFSWTGFGDGSFETPVVTPGTFQEPRQGQSIGPWTVTTGSVDLNGAGFYQAADGVQTLDLNGNQIGAVSQTFSTLPLFSYQVTFSLAGNVDAGPSVKTGQVLVNGKAVKNFSFDTTGKTRANMGYVTETLSFLATGTSTTLEFASTTPGAYGPVIDNVRVESCLPLICLG
jgi:choice-of-anchor C domain-containing protein